MDRRTELLQQAASAHGWSVKTHNLRSGTFKLTDGHTTRTGSMSRKPTASEIVTAARLTVACGALS